MVTGQVEMQVQDLVGGAKATLSQSRPSSLRLTSDTSLFALLLRDRLPSGAAQPATTLPDPARRKLEGRELFAGETLRTTGGTPDELNQGKVLPDDPGVIQRAPLDVQSSALSAGQAFGENGPVANLTLRSATRQKVDRSQGSDGTSDYSALKAKSPDLTPASGNLVSPAPLLSEVPPSVSLATLSALATEPSTTGMEKSSPVARRSSARNGQEYGAISPRGVNGALRRKNQESVAPNSTTTSLVDGTEISSSVHGQSSSQDSSDGNLSHKEASGKETIASVDPLLGAVVSEPVTTPPESVIASVIPAIVVPNGAAVRVEKEAGSAAIASTQVSADLVPVWGKTSPEKSSNLSAGKSVSKERVRTPKGSSESAATAAADIMAGAVLSSAPAPQEVTRPIQGAASRSAEIKSYRQAAGKALPQAASSTSVTNDSAPVVLASAQSPVATAVIAPKTVFSVASVVNTMAAAAPAAASVRSEVATPVQSATSVIAEIASRPQVAAAASQQFAMPTPVTTASEPVLSAPVSVATAAVAPESSPSVTPVVNTVATAAVAPESGPSVAPVVDATVTATPAAASVRSEVVTPVQSATPGIAEIPSRLQVAAATTPQAVIPTPVTTSSEPVLSAPTTVATAAVTPESAPSVTPVVNTVATAAVAPESAPSVAPVINTVASATPAVATVRPEVAAPVQSTTPGIAEIPSRQQTVAGAPQQTVTPTPVATTSEPVVSALEPLRVTPNSISVIAPAIASNMTGSTLSQVSSAKDETTFTTDSAATSPGVSVKTDNPDGKAIKLDSTIHGEVRGNSLDGTVASLAVAPPTTAVNLKTDNTIADSSIAQLKPVASATRVPRKGVPVDSETSESVPTQRASASDGKLTSAKVDVTFSNSSSGDSSTSNGKEQPGSQGKGKDTHDQTFTMTSPHVVEMRELAPASTPNSGDEVRSALKESVLSQVRHAEPIHDGKGASTISLKLNPEDLGELTINVRVEDQRLKVEVVSENRSVRDALMNNMESLKETLLKQHFTMERFDVSTGANSNGSNQAFTGDTGEQRNNTPRHFSRGGELVDLPESKQVTGDGDGEESLLNVRA